MPGTDGGRLTHTDILIAAWVVIAIAGLFLLDISQPRGVVDGVGYAAVVAVSVRFGRRWLVGTASAATILTLLAAGMLPDAGISVAGMWANRAFGIASIWIIALLLQSRIVLQGRLLDRGDHMRRHQAALAQMVREGVLSGDDFSQRLRRVCQLGVEAMDVEGGAFFRRNPEQGTVTVIQSWRRDAGKPFFQPGDTMNEDPAHKARLIGDLVVATADMELSQSFTTLRPALRRFGIRATLAAEVFHGASSSATVGFAQEAPHRWTDEDIAFAQAVAGLVGLLISVERNSETLAALDFAADGICIEDAAGKVQYANRAARQFSADCLWPLPPLAPVQQRDRHEIALQGRDLEVHRSRLPAGGVITRIADVTERNHAAAERARLEARLHEAAKMEAVGQLASGVSHDFNNILAAIAGFAGFIAQDQDAGTENRAFAQRILSACDRGKELVEQIVTFADTRAVPRAVFDLARAVRRSQELLASTMHPGALLEVELPREPLWVSGNEVQAGRMVANLIVNARDALDGRGGGIEVDAAPAPDGEVQALARFRDGPLPPGERLFGEIAAARRYVRLRVADSGAGIAPDLMDRVFEPFFTTKRRHRGTGLGLAVVLSAVKAHGGACHVRSAPGKGTMFSIYLPLAQDRPQGEARPSIHTPCRVMVVDDEADIVDLLSLGLERLGFLTVAVQDPLEALAAIQEDPSAFDAVLTDHDMPSLAGTELIRRIKVIAPRMRAVLCTGHEAVSEQVAREAGADAFLRKPVDIQAAAAALSAPVAAGTV